MMAAVVLFTKDAWGGLLPLWASVSSSVMMMIRRAQLPRTGHEVTIQRWRGECFEN